MHYFVDGYNLLFRVLRGHDNLNKQRQDLINDFATKNALLDLDITLVFDSHYQKEPATRQCLQKIEVVFTAVGQTADEFIVQALKEVTDPAQHTVITSDKKLAWYARRRLAKTQSVEEFIDLFNKRYRNKLKRKKTSVQKESITAQAQPKAPVRTLQKKPQSELEYYLETFEKKLANEEACHPPKLQKKQARRPKKERKPPVAPEDSKESDEERWLRLFQRPAEESF